MRLGLGLWLGLGLTLGLVAYQCWRFTPVNQLKKAIVPKRGKVLQRLVDLAIGQWRRRCHTVFDASSSSKVDTLNIWCENCEMWFCYTITETTKTLFLLLISQNVLLQKSSCF